MRSAIIAIAGLAAVSPALAGAPAGAVDQRRATEATDRMSPLAVTDLANLANRLGRVETRRLITEGGKTGPGIANGVMVSPCYMLTNYHVVFGDERNPRSGDEYPIYFYIGRGTVAFKYRFEGRPIHWGTGSADGGGDYAIVRIDKCPGRLLGWIKLSPAPHRDLRGATLTMAVIPAQTADGSITTSTCKGVDRQPVTNLMSVTCHYENGYSGGALLVEDRTTGLALVAINQAIAEDGTRTATTVNEVLNDPFVAGLLATDLQAFRDELHGRSQAKTR